MTTVKLWPSANGVFNTWSSLLAAQQWEETAQTAVSQPTTPSVTRGIKSLVKGQRQSFSYATEAKEKLPEKAVIKKIVFWYYAKPSNAKMMIVLADTGTGGWEVQKEAGGTTAEWRSIEVPKASAEKSDAPNFYGSAVTSLFNNEKETESRVHDCYYEVEYELVGGAFAIAPVFGGAGSFLAKMNAPRQLAATMSSLGSFVVGLNFPRKILAAWNATSTFAGKINSPRQLAQSLAGKSGFAMTANLPRKLLAAWNGAGGLSVGLSFRRKLVAAFSGVGRFVAEITAVAPGLPAPSTTRITVERASRATVEPEATRVQVDQQTRVVVDA